MTLTLTAIKWVENRKSFVSHIFHNTDVTING